MDGLPDMQVPEVGREHLGGNLVLLRCAEAKTRADVLLGHLRPGSAQARPARRWVATRCRSCSAAAFRCVAIASCHFDLPQTVGACLACWPWARVMIGTVPTPARSTPPA